MALLPKLTIPGWLKIGLQVIQFLPVPIWVKAIDSALQAIIAALPQDQQAPARADLDSATLQALRTKSHEPMHSFVNDWFSPAEVKT